MVFALATDDRTLMVFPDESDAIAYCEGIDVEAGGWAFFDNDGRPLDPVFTKPNFKAGPIVGSGTYVLRPTPSASAQPLTQRLHEVAAVEGPENLRTVADVERLLTLRRRPTP
jgi:hypothetical protein